MMSLNEILMLSAARHTHLCPRQVLGARMGLAGLQVLGFEPRGRSKRLLVIVETDGCFADGIEAATGCSVGHRTLRVQDFGKTAATFVDCTTGRTVRAAPARDLRRLAMAYAPGEKRPYFAQLAAYQVMPDAELFSIQSVCLSTPVEALVSRPGVRVNCALCGEEIINGREVIQRGLTLCRACAGNAYYQPVVVEMPETIFDFISVTD